MVRGSGKSEFTPPAPKSKAGVITHIYKASTEDKGQTKLDSWGLLATSLAAKRWAAQWAASLASRQKTREIEQNMQHSSLSGKAHGCIHAYPPTQLYTYDSPDTQSKTLCFRIEILLSSGITLYQNK